MSETGDVQFFLFHHIHAGEATGKDPGNIYCALGAVYLEKKRTAERGRGGGSRDEGQ
jgi:hypothetical protein